MPVLFGNIYYLPAIVVVVLLLVLLLVVLLRKQRSAKGEVYEMIAAPAMEPVPAVPPQVAQQYAQPIPAPPVQAQPEELVAQEPGKKRHKEKRGKKSNAEVENYVAEQPQESTPAPRQAGSRSMAAVPIPDPLTLSGPLTGIIVDIIQGWGDIEDADLNRLKLFRPEKVRAAIQDFQLPKEMKSDQQAFNRFSTLQRWAAELPDSPSVVPQPAAPAEVAPQPPQPPQTPRPAQPFIQPIDFAETFASIQAVQMPAPQQAPQAQTYMSTRTDAVAQATTPPTLSFSTPLATTPGPEVAPAPPSAPTVALDEGWATVEEQIRNEPAPSEFALVEPRTASDLMLLPDEDRRKKVVHLDPPELAKVFDQTNDPELKKAVINRLENAGNPASLEVLRRCLDDPDPEIQYHALQAADRLLGVD